MAALAVDAQVARAHSGVALQHNTLVVLPRGGEIAQAETAPVDDRLVNIGMLAHPGEMGHRAACGEAKDHQTACLRLRVPHIG